MKKIKCEEFSDNLFFLTEECIYEVLEKFDESQAIDKTLTFVFIKALYMHIANICLIESDNMDKFGKIFEDYKKILKEYYKKNNPEIDEDLLEEIMNAYNTSFEMVNTIAFTKIDDSYELRHHIIDCMELLRQILSKKSNKKIHPDFFDKYIDDLKDKSDIIVDLCKDYKIE